MNLLSFLLVHVQSKVLVIEIRAEIYVTRSPSNGHNVPRVVPPDYAVNRWTRNWDFSHNVTVIVVLIELGAVTAHENDIVQEARDVDLTRKGKF